MVQIDYFFATISPFTYLAGNRLEEVAARHGATIRYLPINAPAIFPRTGGQVLADRHESRKEYRLQELRRWSRRLGMKLDMAPAFFPGQSGAVVLCRDHGGQNRRGRSGGAGAGLSPRGVGRGAQHRG